MKKITYLLIIIELCGCTSDFEDLNTNPNNPNTASENLLLPTVIFDLSNIIVNETYNFGDVIAHYAAQYENNSIDIYRWQADDRFWTPMYKILQNINDIKLIAEENNNDNYKAITLILEAYIFSIITDAYGDVPMLESNRTEEGLINPVYDSQQDIYTLLFEKLEEANDIINQSDPIDGDILYGGDTSKWKKFANSLHLRLLLRISNIQNVDSKMMTLLNNPDIFPIFDSNVDNAIYKYTGNLPDVSEISQTGGGRGYEYYLRVPTTHFIDLLSNNSDPRLELFVSPRDCDVNNPDCVSDLLQGLEPGQSISNNGRPADFSRRAVSFFESPTKIQGIFMTFSELNFILAEARENGFIMTSDAETYYNTAIQASFEQWDVTIPSDFLTTTIPYDNNTDRLYEQKWLALYHSGVESWFDWKRTGKPSFIQAGTGNLNDGKVPVRLKYPSLEQSVNTENYENASAAMGGDNINSSSWWW